MTDYRTLSEFEQKKVEAEVIKGIEPGPRKNEANGFEWVEPDFTLNDIRNGYSCAVCWNVYYNCLCSHGD
jgi:hypothetical protein